MSRRKTIFNLSLFLTLAITNTITGVQPQTKTIKEKINTIQARKITRDYDYNRPVSASELSDIRYIVLTLSNTPLLKLRKYKKEIENAGDRVNNVHPLNFWRMIFTDKEMIAAMHNIKGRDKIWKSFVNGSTGGFDDAVTLKQMNSTFYQDFANRVGVDVNIITPALVNHEWGNFIKLLLIHIPREGNSDRYNM